MQRSLLGIGLDNSQSLSSQIDNDQFSRSIEKMIKAFEPRLADVSVYVQESAPQKTSFVFRSWRRLKPLRESMCFCLIPISASRIK
ncbi:hypothetical protein JCM19233_6275 [Vibrio astriarenae]|nr:hypothetical protein JCM19233_6275 [Vibrio sp. C7]